MLRNLLTPNALRDIASGVAWSRETTLPRLLLRDAKTILVRLLLDAMPALTTEVLLRRAREKATAIGSDCFCLHHDCDMKACPEDGAHD